ncbi:DNA cytosine methyltransferase [Clostridium estertheticum]|uniref:DNA cytosine methyltransferase n=1 Tax=Clostridium estertheticum TaxID=238834 RepID=UPI001C0E30DC|nr:DNA cytosine methyltransferase [Clostridium estertheticum]MBU3075608.1 DNA cytosine methyltransferase [Clostridium estertheticum]MBU3164810.1 DNA cytosine methyltransferase [Clostridium estertheticum]
MKAVSLFANIGVAEAYLKDIGINVVVANEIIKRRADLYAKIYQETKMICGDINDKTIFNTLIKECMENDVEVLMATPPCQGMSTAGPQQKDDKRNSLIIPVINFIKEVRPKYIFLENIPLLLSTEIMYDNEKIIIPDLIKRELELEYHIEVNIINTKDYSVPQTRERAIILMSRRDQFRVWRVPDKDRRIITMLEAIGELPTIDPYIRDISEEELLKMFPLFHERKKAALEISKWNNPPHHIKRQVEAMMHTPTGCTAFDNNHYIPVKQNGEPVRGYKNTYKRQNWDSPAYTVTMDNRKISSQNNVHPGRYLGQDENDDCVFSDARALTVYELMIIMSLPSNWKIPNNTPEAFFRSAIGEGIPPLFVKKIYKNLVR